MTPAQLQLLLKELFDKLTLVSTELTAAKDKLAKVDKVTVEMEENYKGAIEDHKKVKNTDVVSLEAFKIMKKSEELIKATLNLGKSNKAKIERDIEELTKTKNSIKAEYEKTDKALKAALNNVEVLYAS